MVGWVVVHGRSPMVELKEERVSIWYLGRVGYDSFSGVLHGSTCERVSFLGKCCWVCGSDGKQTQCDRTRDTV